MLKRMSLRLACLYSNCHTKREPPNVFGMGPAFMDDISIFKYKRIRFHFTPLHKDYRTIGVFHTFLSPMLPKRSKYSKTKLGGRNRIYTSSNIRLFERRRFIKVFKAISKK